MLRKAGYVVVLSFPGGDVLDLYPVVVVCMCKSVCVWVSGGSHSSVKYTHSR